MSEKDKEFHSLHETVGSGVADYCRKKYPKHTAKMVARDIGVEPVTAKNWLAGNLPGSKHLLTMLHKWGPDFWACMLEPLDAAEARRVKLDNELKRLEQELGALKKEINTQPKD